MPSMAGMSGMRYRTFLLWNAIGGVIWAPGCVLLGYAVRVGAGRRRRDADLGAARDPRRHHRGRGRPARPPAPRGGGRGRGLRRGRRRRRGVSAVSARRDRRRRRRDRRRAHRVVARDLRRRTCPSTCGTRSTGRPPPHRCAVAADGRAIRTRWSPRSTARSRRTRFYGPCRDDDLPDAGEIYAIYAHPDHWSTGLGRALLPAAIEHARSVRSCSGCSRTTPGRGGSTRSPVSARTARASRPTCPAGCSCRRSRYRLD